MRQEHTTSGIKTVPPAGIICAPTYDLLRHSTLNRFFEEFPSLRRYYKEYHKEINIPIAKEGKKVHYSKIFTRSLENPEMIRGLKSWWFWADEGDVAPEESWEILKSRIADHEDGQGLVTSTLARNSWINRLIKQPLDAGKISGVDIISWPSNDRPGFPKSEWDRLKSEMDPVQFARDYGGEFSFEEGLVYGGILSYGIIQEVPESVTLLALFFAVDYGLNHPTVIMVAGYGSDGAYYILDEVYSPMLDVDQINEELQIFLDRYRYIGDPWATYYDPAGGVAALSLLPDCFPIPAVKEVDNRITLVRNLIFQKRVFILENCTETVKEVAKYSFTNSTHQPVDKDNHAMDDLGYIIHNSWGSVQELKKELPKPQISRVAQYYEDRGLLKDNQFHYTLEPNEDNFIL
jgi:hypothetical protein